MGIKEKSSTPASGSHVVGTALPGQHWEHWTGMKYGRAHHGGDTKPLKQPNLPTTGFLGMTGALTLGSMDPVRSRALSSWVVGERKGFFSLP